MKSHREKHLKKSWQHNKGRRVNSFLSPVSPVLLLLLATTFFFSFFSFLVRSNANDNFLWERLYFFNNQELHPKSLRRWESLQRVRRTNLGDGSMDPCRIGRYCCWSSVPISWRHDGPVAISNAQPLGRYRPLSANNRLEWPQFLFLFCFPFWKLYLPTVEEIARHEGSTRCLFVYLTLPRCWRRDVG